MENGTDKEGNTRYYEGFNCPSAYNISSPDEGGSPAASSAFMNGATSSARNFTMVRRSTANNTNGNGAVSITTFSKPTSVAVSGTSAYGYGYFHRHTSSAGEHSGLALSDTGSSASNPLHAHRLALRQQRASNRRQTTSPVRVNIHEGSQASDTAGGNSSAQPPSSIFFSAAAEGNAGGTVMDIPVGSATSSAAAVPVNTSRSMLTTTVSFLPPPTLSINEPKPLGSVSEDLTPPQLPGTAATGPEALASRPAIPFIPFHTFSAPTPSMVLHGNNTGGDGTAAATAGGQHNTSFINSQSGGFLKNTFLRFLQFLEGSEEFGKISHDNHSSQPQQRPLYQIRFGFPEDDFSLLEELDIDPWNILRKSYTVLNPLRSVPGEVVHDTDLAGPLVFAVLLAFLLSLQGKIQFSAIYGLCVSGILFFKLLLTLMCVREAPAQFIMSCLGYAFMPNLLLALLRTVQYWLFGSFTRALLPLALIVISWSSWCATSLLVKGLAMEAQRCLILYPVFLFYSAFAALTIF